MNKPEKVWIPQNQSGELLSLLSVTATSKPNPELYLMLFRRKLQALIAQDPKEARQAMELSQEQAPELWAIAEQSSVGEWASQLVSSDSMIQLLKTIDWSKPGRVSESQEPISLQEITEQML